MKIEIEKQPNKTFKLKITIAAEKVAQTREHVIEEMVKETEVPGFRKGSAPRAVVEPKLDLGKIRGEVINHLIPQSYDQAVKESLLKPFLLPKIEILSFEDGQDLIFTALSCEAPEVKLSDYKNELSKVKGQRSEVILGPDGQPLSPINEKTDDQEKLINLILETLLKTSQVDLPDLLVDDEVGRMLGRLVDQTGRLGLTVDQYLKSVDKTAENLREEYRQAAQKNLKLEFLLMQIAKEESIKVEPDEISATINSAPDEESRKSLSQPENRTYLESVLIKNKVIQKLLELT